jgi:hypothetical protein
MISARYNCAKFETFKDEDVSDQITYSRKVVITALHDQRHRPPDDLIEGRQASCWPGAIAGAKQASMPARRRAIVSSVSPTGRRTI